MNQVVLIESWQHICQQMKKDQQVDWNQFASVKDKLVPQAMSDGFLLLTIDSRFLKNWVVKNFLSGIKSALFTIYGKPYEVLIELDEIDEEDEEETTPAPQPQISHPQNNNIYISKEPVAQISAEVDPIDAQEEVVEAQINVRREVILQPKLTFQNFVIGDSNQLAYSMAAQVAENPGSSFSNPLFIYGKSGLGKTHLLRAIQNDILKIHPGYYALYVDTNDLVNDYTRAAQEHEREKNSFYNFREKYETADVLLIDDVQFLQGKKQTLDNVFQILNHLIAQGKQIVLSADRSPSVIDFDERYTSRFLQGGLCDIQPPEFETKVAIIKNLIAEYNSQSSENEIFIPESIIDYTAENSGSNIRELKGAVSMILYTYRFSADSLDEEEIKQSLLKHFTSIKNNLTIEDIQKVVEDYYKVSHDDIISTKRSKNIAYARQMALYLCRTILDIPYMELGDHFNRDHTTVLYAVQKIEQELLKNRKVQEEMEILRKVIKDL